MCALYYHIIMQTTPSSLQVDVLQNSLYNSPTSTSPRYKAAVVVDCGEDEQSLCDPQHSERLQPSEQSCDPITVLNDDQDEDIVVPNHSSDHVMSGSDPDTRPDNRSIKGKKRKLLDSFYNWQPTPVNVQGVATKTFYSQSKSDYPKYNYASYISSKLRTIVCICTYII